MKEHHLVSWSATVLLALVAICGLEQSSPAQNPKAVLQTNGPGVNCLAFSPEGTMIAVACENSDVELWEVRTGERQSTLRGHTGPVQSVGFSGNGRLLASCGVDGTIRLWDMTTGKTMATLRRGKGSISSVAFSPDSKLLASGGDDRAVEVWDVDTGKLRSTFRGHTKGQITLFGHTVMSVAFSPDGKLLASAGADGMVKLWDVARDRLKATLIGSSSKGIRSVAFGGDGKLLASGGCDGNVKLWDVATGKVKAVLKGHKWTVSSVAFSPDGKLLASVSGNGIGDEEWEEPPERCYEINVWDVATGRVLARLSGETGQMWSVAFSPDGKLLGTGDWTDIAFPNDGPGRVRLWDVQVILKAKK